VSRALPPSSEDGGSRAPELQHFRAFEAIARLGSLTQAAQELGLTQPALSKALGLLRRYYGDELFLRSKQGMRPTPLARRLQADVHELVGLVEHRLRARAPFDPARSSRTFRISCTEVGAIHFMPRLLAAVRDSAPGVRWEVVPLAGEALGGLLASGEVDLALAAFLEMQPGLCSQALYRVGHRCLVRDGHPRIRHELSLERFCAEKHVVAHVSDVQHAYRRVEQAIVQAAGPGAIGLRVHSLLTAPFIVAQSDHIFTATEQIAQQMAQLPGLRLLPCPLPLPPIVVHQYWHSHQAQDPAVSWLRGLVATHFAAHFAQPLDTPSARPHAAATDAAVAHAARA